MGKQVKIPRFYVDMPTFLYATGQLGWDDSNGGVELLYMNPSNPFIGADSETMFVIGDETNNAPKTSFPINFVALLNHNLASDENNCRIMGEYYKFDTDTTPEVGLCNNSNGFTEVLNANHYEDGTDDFIDPNYNGTSIWTFNDENGMDKYWKSFEISFSTGFDDYPHQLGSFVLGKYWDAPNSPDLELTMSRRFEGIKLQKTTEGKTLANIYYDGPTEWFMNGPSSEGLPSNSQNEHWTNDFGPEGFYRYPPFELDLPTPITRHETDTDGLITNYSDVEKDYNRRVKPSAGRKGLRSWKLSFSYISEDDMWMDNEVASKVTSDSIDDGENPTGGSDPNPMLSDDSFNFVWNCTLGGSLPFIFQPDNTNNNPDQFSICTFRSNTLSVKQVAYNTYSLSVTIDEVA